MSVAVGLAAIAVAILGHALAVLVGSVTEQRTVRKIHAERMTRKVVGDGRQDAN